MDWWCTLTAQTAPVLPFPGSGPCGACIAWAWGIDRRAEIVRRAYQEPIVESGVKRGVKREWDKREAGETDGD